MALRNEAPAERAAAVSAAFTAKIELLEAWAKNGVPENIDWPRTRTALRAWRGPEGNLRQWADPHIDQPRTGKHPDLAQRYLNAKAQIEIRQAAKGDRLKQAQADAKLAEDERNALRIQNTLLIARIDALEREIALLKGHSEAKGRKPT